MTKFASTRTPALLSWTLVGKLLYAKAQPRHVEAQMRAEPAASAQAKDDAKHEAKDLLQRLREAGL